MGSGVASTYRELRDLLGEDACRASDALVAAAPPLTTRQLDELAVILRRAFPVLPDVTVGQTAAA